MKWIACWIWVFCLTCDASLKKFRQIDKHFCFPRRCRRRLSGLPPGCCAIPSWWKLACAVRRRKRSHTRFTPWPPNKSSISSWRCWSAQTGGDAFTLMTGEELPALQAIERFIGQKIPRLKLENFSYVYTVLFEPEAAAGGKRAIGGGRTHRGYSFGRRRR